MTPLLVVLSSPSGGGKSSIRQALLARRSDLGYSVSATTRPMRPGEVDGADYHFLGVAQFEARVAAGEFLEWARYGRNLYGTLRAEVARQHAAGRHVILDIEVEGTRQLREAAPDAVLVFVLPPSAAVLRQRLAGRQTESAAEIAGRLRRAADEIAAAGTYDYVVVNDDLARAVHAVEAIIDAEVLRTARRPALPQELDALARAVRHEASLVQEPQEAGRKG